MFAPLIPFMYVDIVVDNIDYLSHSKNQDKTILNDEVEEEMDK